MRVRMLSAAMVSLIVFSMAACDTTPPMFTQHVDVAFVVGGQIATSDAAGDEDAFTFGIPRRLTWAAVDDDEGCQLRYDVEQVFAGLEPDLILENDPRTQLDVDHDDYNGDFGGGSLVVTGWNVIAHDCANHAQMSEISYRPNVWQETGQNPQAPFEVPDITFTGTWTTQTGAWASGGQQRFTSAANASVSFTHDFAFDGRHLALVMAKGPGRGSADVYIDEVKVATVNTNAPANDNRRILFDQRMTAGTHTVRVVNLATAGHPRIDIDAFLT